MSKKRNHRQRKKLHLGEYKELGFTFSVEFHEELDSAAHDALLEAFISEVIEQRQLMCGGSFSWGFVCRDTRCDASDEDRVAVRDWLAARGEIKSAEVSELVDAWR